MKTNITAAKQPKARQLSSEEERIFLYGKPEAYALLMASMPRGPIELLSPTGRSLHVRH